MKTALLAAAAVALSAVAASPAAAQATSIGIADPALAIASSTPLQNAYQQIATTYEAQRGQLAQLQQQREGLIRQFDTDGDGQLNEAEQTAAAANTSVRQQIEALDQNIGTIQNPIAAAQIYALEQLLQQFNPAVEQVVAARGVQMILTPGVAVYAGQGTDLTGAIRDAVNQLAPAVATTPPAGWQPQRQTVELYQEVMQILQIAAIQQQAAGGAAQPQQPVEGR